VEEAIQAEINRANTLVNNDKVGPRKRLTLSYVLLAAIAHGYLTNTPAAQFKLTSSPLVMWLWIGALIVFAGGLTAIWPTGGATARVRARYFARVAQELGRA
jgi:cytochrome c biogenesis factor